MIIYMLGITTSRYSLCSLIIWWRTWWIQGLQCTQGAKARKKTQNFCVDPCWSVLHTESLQQPLRCSIWVLAPGVGGQGFRNGPKIRLCRILDAVGVGPLLNNRFVFSIFSLSPIVLVMSTLQKGFISYKHDSNGPLWPLALSVPPAPLLDKLKARFSDRFW